MQINNKQIGAHNGSGPKALAVGSLLMATTASTASAQQKRGHGHDRIDPPNILLIVADDYGVDASQLYPPMGSFDRLIMDEDDFDRRESGDESYFGTVQNPEAPPTPNIADIAQEGVLYLNAWANPACSPTRAGLLSGRHAFRHGVGSPITPIAPPSAQLGLDEFTLKRAFDANPQLDYGTAVIGKWHVTTGITDPNVIGGDRFAGSLFGFVAGLFPDNYDRWNKVIDGVPSVSTTYPTTDQVDEALRFIGEQEMAGKPWFTYVAFLAPHDPFHLPPLDLHDFDDLPDTPEAIAANPIPYYDAAVQAMDTEIGRLLDGVDLTNTMSFSSVITGRREKLFVPDPTRHARRAPCTKAA